MLTRPELQSLDQYLARHGFGDLNVTEAYDAKGITVSSAGAAATTAQGRATILQQMANNLLNALFSGQSVAAPRTDLQEQYQAQLRQEEQQRHQARQRQPQTSGLNPNAPSFSTGLYASEDGGLMVIDDDQFPGLRGGGSHTTYQLNLARAAATTTPVEAFPALSASPAPAPSLAPAAPPAVSATASKKSKTLAKITGAVKKTNPKEQQKQWEAREAARKRAMMANLSFGVPPGLQQSVGDPINGGLVTPPSMVSRPEASAAQLERNKAFAEALGVQPATRRQSSINSGWARPTAGKVTLDEFGNELNAAIYPDSLIAAAKDRMGLLLKVEKKWKTFLKDDKAASMPLNSMDRPARKFVHHYSDFWNLRTESFDPEPRRYIHCVKLTETHMPHPLLSDVARNWRGPSLPKTSPVDHPTQQTAGQSTAGREMRSLLLLDTDDGDDSAVPIVNSRLEGLVDTHGERTKLELAPRTKPIDEDNLPAEEPPKDFQEHFEVERLEREVKQQKRQEKKRQAAEAKARALANAFASDDESSHGSGVADDGSDWGAEPTPQFVGEEEED